MEFVDLLQHHAFPCEFLALPVFARGTLRRATGWPLLFLLQRSEVLWPGQNLAQA